MDVLVIMQRRFVSTLEVPQIQFFAGVGGPTSAWCREGFAVLSEFEFSGPRTADREQAAVVCT